MISTPLVAARPSATVTASGVASASAHGQVTTSSDIACSTPVVPPQASVVITASVSTTNTKRPATLSTRRSIAALRVDSSSTWRTSAPTRVASPTAVAVRSIGAPRLVVPAQTASPTPMARGRDSPVRIAASTLERPSTTTPSTGIASPARTRRRSPTATASIGTSVTAPSAPTRRARRGVSAHNSSAAAAALRCERLTIHRDTSSRNVSIARLSK